MDEYCYGREAGERERERQRQTDRDRQTERTRQTDRQTETDRHDAELTMLALDPSP